MVKGITRQVILVKSPDPKLFEEAIFIVKEEALAREGVSADQVIRGGQTGGRTAISAAAGHGTPGAGSFPDRPGELRGRSWPRWPGGWFCFCCNRPEAHAYNGMWTGRAGGPRLPGLPVQG